MVEVLDSDYQVQGPRFKDQGPRPKDQGSRTKDQGPRPKVQGPRTQEAEAWWFFFLVYEGVIWRAVSESRSVPRSDVRPEVVECKTRRWRELTSNIFFVNVKIIIVVELGS